MIENFRRAITIKLNTISLEDGKSSIGKQSDDELEHSQAPSSAKRKKNKEVPKQRSQMLGEPLAKELI